MDYHVVIGTEAQREAIRQQYHREDICDNSGNYPSEYIEGDNKMLKTMVYCAEGDINLNFMYAVEIMSKHIEEHTLAALHKTEDFKYICAVYD